MQETARAVRQTSRVIHLIPAGSKHWFRSHHTAEIGILDFRHYAFKQAVQAELKRGTSAAEASLD